MKKMRVICIDPKSHENLKKDEDYYIDLLSIRGYNGIWEATIYSIYNDNISLGHYSLSCFKQNNYYDIL